MPATETPPLRGPVKEVHLGGALLGFPSCATKVKRDYSKKVKEVVKDLRAKRQSAVKYEGVVREFDKDKLTFILREIPGEHEKKCQISEDLYDEVNEAFIDDMRVGIVGKETVSSGLVQVLAISEIAEGEKSGEGESD